MNAHILCEHSPEAYVNTGSMSQRPFKFHLISRQLTFKYVNIKDESGVERNSISIAFGKRKILQSAFKLQAIFIKFCTRFCPE